ncbi:hypothetical protein [Mesorhizobium sp. B1-1-7]|uniref:hypothetical protein n=1 Tax=Mesorhizobium sp. B1-1-7 TaxID=2589977 RepID=UPI00112BB0B2|nr:hypothetical protein [Mesorhizobium sp. B1-1-7]TPN46370.1 hypothetical protein FJ978_24900 [Mesorhizobium sp. B1-1-7]
MKKKSTFGMPGLIAQLRNVVDGQWPAALLLYRLLYRWSNVPTKLTRNKREWIAMSREDWAREAGLSASEMKNRALPHLRKYTFVAIRAMKLGNVKLLWMSLDPDELESHKTPWDMYEHKLNGGAVIGAKKIPSYPYKKPQNHKAKKL